MDFGNIDINQLLGNLPGGGRSAGGNIKPNMAPPANFWEGDKFNIGAPGLQAGSQQPMPQMPQQAPPVMKSPAMMGGGAGGNVSAPAIGGGGGGNAMISPNGGAQANPFMANPQALGLQGNSLKSLFQNNPFSQTYRSSFS